LPEASLSAREARRIAIVAQGLGRRPRTSEPGTLRLTRTIDGLGAVQIDSVNVVARSHYLPCFSRLGPYVRERLDRAAWGPRPWLFEYWGHMASLMPATLQPLLRWRMARARAGELWSGMARFGRERPDFIQAVLARIEREGPLTGGDFADGPRIPGWWNWSDGKRALEWLFWGGLITTRTRRGFERVYDLTDRVLPRAILETPTPSEPDAHRALLAISSRALGVATAGDLRDYFRMPPRGVADRLAELVETGDLTPVTVEGWRQGAFLARGVAVPRRPSAEALLSPFDNLIWTRDRAERLFGARIRLEIYTPAYRREHGYYVLPFLLGDTLVARVDLKADRAARVLRVQAAHGEDNADPLATPIALADSLRRLAAWLGLEDVTVARKGDLADTLERAVA
jgi:uncharacterized protein YcaQ